MSDDPAYVGKLAQHSVKTHSGDRQRCVEHEPDDWTQDVFAKRLSVAGSIG